MDRDVVIRVDGGLHLRLAGAIVRVAREHRAQVQVSCRDCRRADGSSILELLLLGAGPGTEVHLRAEGPEAERALDAVQQILIHGEGI